MTTTPKDILTLLDIVEKSGKSPSYAHITSAAHQSLLNAKMEVEKEKEEQSPPSKKAKE